MSSFSFAHSRRESGIDSILNLTDVKKNDLKSVYCYGEKRDIRNDLIKLEKRFRLNYEEYLKKLDCLETFLLARGFVHIMNYENWISQIIPSISKRIELNDCYPIFVKNIDNRYWIEISYSFNAEVTSDIDRISKEHFIIYDAGGGSRFSLMWVGGTNIFGITSNKPCCYNIYMLLDNYLNG